MIAITKRDERVQGDTPDGAYYRVEEDRAQIIIVGAPLGRPVDYLNALVLEIGGFWRISGGFLMSNVNPAQNDETFQRGYWAIGFRRAA